MLLLYEIKLRKLTKTDINYRFPFQFLIKYFFFNKNSIIISKNTYSAYSVFIPTIIFHILKNV